MDWYSQKETMMPDMTLIEAIVSEAYGVELEHTAGDSRKAYIASAEAILDIVREAITSDAAVEAFGKAWNQQAVDDLLTAYVPGRKRRAGLTAVANLISKGE